MWVRILIATFFVMSVVGCDWTVYDELEDSAQTIALSGSADFESGSFGQGLATFSGPIGGALSSRIAVSGGADSPFTSFRAWDGSRLAPGNPLFEACVEGCNGEGEFLAGVAAFGGAEGCVFATAPGSQRVVMRCESEVGTLSFPAPTASLDFGASLEAIDNGGVALLVGDSGLDGNGGLYSIPSVMNVGMASIVPVMVAGAGRSVAMGARFGSTITSTVSGGATAIAVGAPGVGLVAVGSLAGAQTFMTQGCVDGGERIAMGTDSRDGTARLFVGSGSEIRVHLVSSVNGGCSAMEPTPTPTATVMCAGCASIATGDVDGDGDVDLIAGEPGFTADGEPGAGAVHIFAGPDYTQQVTLTHSNPSANAALGTKVAAVMTAMGGMERAEPVASAPGDDRVYVLTCTGLSNDSPGSDFSCVPR